MTLNQILMGSRQPYWVLFLLCAYTCTLSILTSAYVEKCQQNTTDTKLVANGYEDLLILVEDDVEADYNLIGDLRKLLNMMSERMFQITKRRAYIRQVSILLPQSWGAPPTELEDIMRVKTDTVHSGERGDFRLKNRSPRSENEAVSWTLGDEEAQVDIPYVIKPTPCGYSGRYLRMTPEFVRFGSRAEDLIGKPDKVLLRQWAKLRWGVYDEVPRDEAASNFYIHTDLKIHPIACSMAIKGRIVNSNVPTQTCSQENAINNKACEFLPDSDAGVAKKTSLQEENQGGYASLMYRPNLDHVDQFCDSDEATKEKIPIELQHNAEAPTVHNLHCQGRSVWEVMRDHPDFRNGNNPPLPETFILPPVEFRLLQNPDRRIVLVLDVSTSMARFNRLKLMRQAASQFIETVPERSWVGIVTFAVEATVKSELVEVESNSVRQSLKRRLPTKLVTGTSIGRGILKALDVLKNSGPKHMRNSGGSMLVLSDGKEHNIPKINDTLDKVLKFGVRVTTIAFGDDVSDDLEKLSSVTGGSSYFASSGEFSDNSELRNAFLAAIQSREDDVVVVSSRSVRIRRNSTIQHDFIIDETIGSETRITVLYTDAVAPLIGLRSPTGYTVWEYDDIDIMNITADFMWDKEFSTKTIQFHEKLEDGKWKLLLNNQMIRRGVQVDVTVFSRPVNQQESLVLSPALLCRQINYTGIENVVVYAHLSLGEFAVLDARVDAAVTRPLSGSGSYDTAIVSLKDDGRGADVIADDGIYSGYFTEFTIQGRYNVKVNASDDGTARIDTEYRLGLGRRTDQPVFVDTSDIVQSISDEEEKPRLRRRRAIRSGLLSPFSRWSTQQKDFIVDQAVAVVCPEGYKHFQDSCYKFVRVPRLTAEKASAFCRKERGHLVKVNSKQEFMYIFDRVRGKNTWFGGIDKSLDDEDIFDQKRFRRQSQDEDLTAVAEAFRAVRIDERLRKVIESFSPDFEGLSRKEINRIMQILGITSVSDIERLKETTLLNSQDLERLLITPEFPRIRRQPETPLLGSGDFTTVPSVTELSFMENLTLALAVGAPIPDEFESSGDAESRCFWLDNGRVVATSGEFCKINKAFYCERPKLDIVPPSRITDLRILKTSDPDILKFTWTSTGDDYTTGTATRYELRSLRTTRALRLLRNFDLGEAVKRTAVIQGSLDEPKLSGLREELLINRSSIIGCPAHAAVDLILVLPQRILSPKQMTKTQREGTYMMFQSLLNLFKISQYELQVSLIVFNNQAGRAVFRDITNREQALDVLDNGIEFDNTRLEDRRERNLADVLNERLLAGRDEIPKLLLSLVTNEDLNSTNILTDFKKRVPLVLVGIDITDRINFRSLVSSPTCENAIHVENWSLLNSTVPFITRQICRARTDEYQAWGIAAVDEEGQRGEPSNIVSSIIENRPEPVLCSADPTEAPLPSVAGVDPTVVSLAVGIPLAVILGIIGLVMIFGQVKKRRRKKQLEKERQAVEEESKAAEGSRSTRTMRSNKTAPISQPPV